MSTHPDEAAAALVALLAAAAAAQPTEPTRSTSNWNSHHRNLQVPLPRGRAAWRDSLRKP